VVHHSYSSLGLRATIRLGCPGRLKLQFTQALELQFTWAARGIPKLQFTQARPRQSARPARQQASPSSRPSNGLDASQWGSTGAAAQRPALDSAPWPRTL
jgi:hypothetical protein